MILKQFNKNDTIFRLIAFLIIALLAVASTVLFFSADDFKIYKYRLTNLGNGVAQRKNILYYDMNGDGKSESFRFSVKPDEDVVEFYNENGGFIDVLRPGGNFLNNYPSYVFGDADKDNYTELYLFSLRNDSILLNSYELLGDDGHIIVDLLIDTIFQDEERNDFALLEPKMVDLDLDGFDEILFIIRAGYSLVPRKVYSLNPRTQHLDYTENSAAGYIEFEVIPSMSGKGYDVIASTNAVENYSPDDSIDFNDNSGWFIAYEKDLKDTVFVREYPENKSFIRTSVCETPDGKKIYNFIEESRTRRRFLEKMNLNGQREKIVSVSSGTSGIVLMNYFSPSLKHIVIYHADTLITYSTELKLLTKEVKVGIPKNFSSYSGKNFIAEYGLIIFGRGNKLIIRDTKLQIVGTIDVQGFGKDNLYNSSVENFKSPENFTILLDGTSGSHLIAVKKNQLYNLRYGIYILLLLAFCFFYYAVFRIQNHFYNKRSNTQAKITSLQLQTVQNQLQPHFTFNVLNTIGSMIYKNEKEAAYEYLNYFSDMLRTTLLSKNRPNWQVGEELGFIGSYMDMENLRFNNKFIFTQAIAEGTDLTRLVPKLTVQAFVENAVRHGLMHKDGECQLSVSIHQSEDYMSIEIKDNGIGRESAAALPRQQNGLGNEILRDYIFAYNKANKVKFKLTIEDLLSEDGDAAGTKVNLFVPLDL